MLQHRNVELPPLERIGRLTSDQYFAMIKQGGIREGAPYELLDGLLVLKDRSTRGEDHMSIGGPHNYVVGLIFELSLRISGKGCFIQSQGPVRLFIDSVPEPDGAIVRGKRSDYIALPPEASNVCSVIEVADSSLEYDRNSKGPKYAIAGIPQFVLIDLVHSAIEIYENPNTTDRKYDSCRIVTSGQEVDFLLSDGSRLNVPAEELLPIIA